MKTREIIYVSASPVKAFAGVGPEQIQDDNPQPFLPFDVSS
jgi:hypothetical protein